MSTRFYDTDLTDAAWAWVAPVLPTARPGGRPRTTDLRSVLNAVFYLLRTGSQWRPRIRTVIAAGGHQSRKLARALEHEQGWELRIVRRRQRAFKITGLTWIVERSFAWLGRNRRLNKDYEYWVQTSETMIDLAAIRFMLNRIA